MRILYLSAWCPYPADNGAKLRTYHLLRGLSRQHEVDLVTFCPEGDDGPIAAHLGGFCREVTLVAETPFAGRRTAALVGLLSPQPRSFVANFSHTMQAQAQRCWSTGAYDAVVAGSLHMAPYGLPLPGARLILEELELARIYEPYRNAIGTGARLRAGMTWWKTAQFVRRVLRRCAGYSVVSPDEAAIAEPLAPRGMRSAIVPNGVDVAGYTGFAREPAPDTLIYPGALSYDANLDAVAYFAGAILPRVRRHRPAARLLVTGKAAPAQIRSLPSTEGVELTGYLDDVRPAVASAWAEVVPLRRGGGTRLKVLEALALGTPVVATSKGVEGLDLRPGVEFLAADTAEAFAAQTVRLLASPDLRRDLGAAGLAAVGRFDWSHSISRLNALLEQAIMEGVR